MKANLFKDKIYFKHESSGKSFIEVNTSLTTATISLNGGQILSWHPKKEKEPVLWVSNAATYKFGKPIRGGIPICWPWFGPHPDNATLPNHGVARICPWILSSIRIHDDSIVDIQLTLTNLDNFKHKHLFKWLDLVKLTVNYRISDTLEISLTTKNNHDSCEITLTEGLHTYFNVGHIKKIQIDGLSGCEYVDLVKDNKRGLQKEPLTFEKEIGRVYINTDSTCIITDDIFNRQIIVEKKGSFSTVVWNPWINSAANLPDMGPESWQNMVCLESANAYENEISILPLGEHSLVTKYSLK